MIPKSRLFIVFLTLSLQACDKKDGSDSGTAYSFTSSANTTLTSSTISSGVARFLSEMLRLHQGDYDQNGSRTLNKPNGLSQASTAPAVCTDSVCYTPTSLTGKYFGVGLLIQSNNSGMTAYFGDDAWSDVTATSTMYDFDFTTPVSKTGDLICCGGTGDLSSENTYFSDVSYLFAYIDATFTVTSANGESGTALGEHKIRFIFADEAIATAKRGDLMVYDTTDELYKWMDILGNLTETRPNAPITMNSSVTDWTNPWGTTAGNQSIPVFYVQLNEPASGGVFETSETELKTAGKTYSFDFDANGFIVLPTVLKTDAAQIYDLRTLLGLIHVQGLPHSDYELGAAGKTTLTITGP